MDEDFRPLPANDAYRVDRSGYAQSCWARGKGGTYKSDQWRDLASHTINGYRAFYTKVDLKLRRFMAHEAILLAWVGPKPAGMVARHLDDDRDNCHLDNLAWGTRRQNYDDAVRNGKIKLGTSHAQAAITAEQASMLRFFFKGQKIHGLKAADWAKEFGCSVQTIYKYAGGYAA